MTASKKKTNNNNKSLTISRDCITTIIVHRGSHKVMDMNNNQVHGGRQTSTSQMWTFLLHSCKENWMNLLTLTPQCFPSGVFAFEILARRVK